MGAAPSGGTIRVVIDVGDEGRTFVYVRPFDWFSFADELRKIPDSILGSLASDEIRDYAERVAAAKEAS